MYTRCQPTAMHLQRVFSGDHLWCKHARTRPFSDIRGCGAVVDRYRRSLWRCPRRPRLPTGHRHVRSRAQPVGAGPCHTERRADEDHRALLADD
jgi:hypothetical protein